MDPTAPFVERVLERLRRLHGHRQGTDFHGTMEPVWAVLVHGRRRTYSESVV